MKEYTVRVSENGSKFWWLNGQRHREDGPAIEYLSGTKEWRLNGQRHREGGPAIERASGTKEWFLNGRRHREDGPAVEWADGTEEWYLHGQRLTKEEHKRRTTGKDAVKREWVGLTDEERYLNDGRSEEEIEYARAIEAKLKEKNA